MSTPFISHSQLFGHQPQHQASALPPRYSYLRVRYYPGNHSSIDTTNPMAWKGSMTCHTKQCARTHQTWQRTCGRHSTYFTNISSPQGNGSCRKQETSRISKVCHTIRYDHMPQAWQCTSGTYYCSHPSGGVKRFNQNYYAVNLYHARVCPDASIAETRPWRSFKHNTLQPPVDRIHR